jgi:hypothetical protein
VFLDAFLAHVMEVAVVQVIDVAFVANAGVAAARTVLMVVIGVDRMGSGHDFVSLCVDVFRSDLRRSPGFKLVGMRQRVRNQIGNVPVCQSIKRCVPRRRPPFVVAPIR